MFRRSGLILLFCFSIPPAAQVAAADAPPVPVVQLTAQRARFLNHNNFAGGMLLRELQRQALLISARDELGLATRDMVLREPFSPSGTNAATTVLFESRIWRNDHAQICVSKFDGPQPVDPYALADLQVDDAKNTSIKWANFKIAKNPLVDYADFVARCEEASRTSYLYALMAENVLGNYPKHPIPWSTGPASPAALKRLQHLDVFSQYLAVRLLHQQMRAEGESPDRLCALVQGYANLAALTRDQWSRADRVFLARALLYAQRLVVHDDNSAISLNTRAYAFAFAGLHAAALKDLDSANLESDAASAALPWVPLIRAFCHFNADSLEDSAITGPWPYRQLACFLNARVATDMYPRDRQADAMDRALLTYPAMFSLTSLSQQPGDSDNPKPTDRPINQIPIIAGEMLQNAGLSPEINYAVRHLVTGDESFKQLAVLRDRLNHAAATQPVDTSEPSLAVLADLLEQQEVLAVMHKAQSLKATGNAIADIQKLASNAMPILKVHPWGSYIDALGVDPGSGIEQIAKFLNKINDRDPGPWTEDALDAVEGYAGKAEALMRSLRETAEKTSDALAFDFHVTATENELWRIGKTSPHCAALLNAWMRAMPEDRIQQETPLYKSTLTKVETEFTNRPEVGLAACDWCNARGDFQRSIDLLNRIDAIEPSVEICNRQAALARKLGRHEDSINLQMRALKLSNDAEDTATTCQQAAAYLIEDHRFAEALSCVQISADTPTDRTWQLSARCFEGLGQLEDADNCLQQLGALDATTVVGHYLWAWRLGRADARQLHAKVLARLNAQPEDFTSRFFLTLADDQEHKALDALRSNRASIADPYLLAQLIILAKKQNDIEALADGLTSLSQVSMDESFARAFGTFARAHDAAGAMGAYDRWINRQLDMENAVDWYSLAGRYLVAAGNAQEGRGYLAKAIRLTEREKSNYALAWRELLKLGEDPKKLQSVPATQG